MRRLSLSIDKEQLRATLVIGLIASIIALQLYASEVTTPRVSLIFGVLLTYWFLYAVFTAYGISQAQNVKWSNRLRRLGDLFFNFALYFVVAGVVIAIVAEKFGILKVLRWDYSTVFWFSFIAFLAPQIMRFLEELWSWRTFLAHVKSNWRAVLNRWALFLIMSSPLVVLYLYRLLF
jgi:hypothetical protein